MPSVRSAPSRPGRPQPAGSYRALDHAFSVEVAGTALAANLRDHVVRAFGDLAVGPPSDHVYRLTVEAADAGDVVVLERDAAVVGPRAPAAASINHLLSDISLQAVASRPNHLMLHAAGLAMNDYGLLLPGESGSGKSTLAAALVLAGFDYLSDEAVAIDLTSLAIAPYPKPLSLRAGSRARLGLALPASGDPVLIPSSFLRPDSCSQAVPARMLLFPRWNPDGPTDLVRMSRAEAFVEVTNNSFNFVDHGGEWMEPIRRLVTQCWCGRLTVGDVGQVPAIIRPLLPIPGGNQV